MEYELQIWKVVKEGFPSTYHILIQKENAQKTENWVILGISESEAGRVASIVNQEIRVINKTKNR